MTSISRRTIAALALVLACAAASCSKPTAGTWKIDGDATFLTNVDEILASVANQPEPVQKATVAGLKDLFKRIELDVELGSDGTATRTLRVPNVVSNAVSESIMKGTWKEEGQVVVLACREAATGTDYTVNLVREGGTLLDSTILGGVSHTLVLERD